MYCSSCNAENIHTDLRCLRCGASLVGEQVGGSETYRKAARELDAKIYGGVGGFLGAGVAVGFCNTVLSAMYLSNLEIYGSAVFAAIIFSAIGRHIAFRKD